MSETMRIWSEISFNLLYLAVIYWLVILMIRRRGQVMAGNKQLANLFIWAFALLALGDTGHVGFRVWAYALGGLEQTISLFNQEVGLVGLGALATSITVTLFYVLVLVIWHERFGKPYGWLGGLLFAAAAIRFLIMLPPNNEWNSVVPPQPWSLYRNLPLMVQGLGAAYLILRDAYATADRPFTWVGLMILTSYAFYLPVIFLVQRYPLVGMLMIPKTMAYVAIAFIAYFRLFKGRETAVSPNHHPEQSDTFPNRANAITIRAMQVTQSSTQPKRAPGPGYRQMASQFALPFLRGQAMVSLLQQFSRQYGEIVRLPLAPGRVLILLDHPAYFKHVLVTQQRNYIKASPYGLLKKEFGDGLLYSQGESWQRQRRMLQPDFHRKRVAGLTDTITASAAQLAEQWRGYAQSGQVVDIDKEMADVTRLITSLTLLSQDITAEIDAAQKPVENNLTLMLGTIPGTPQHRQIKTAVRDLKERINTALATRKSGQDGDGLLNSHDDLLAMLLDVRDRQTGQGMDDQQIRDEIITFIYAGYDTTSRGLTWTWHLLGQHPDAYDWLQEEVRGVLNGRLPTFDDLPHLPYTQMVVQESLRLMAPIWAIGRRAVDDDEIGGYHVPARAYITMSPYLTHRHPDFWENPEQFDPERFTPERSAQRDRLAYVPFGMGQRLCIGKDLAELEIPLIVATLAQEFRLHPYPDPPVVIDSRLTLQPKHGLPMKVRMIEDC